MQLSVDTLSIVFEFLDTKQLILASRTCKRWRHTFLKYIGKYKIDLLLRNGKITNEHLAYFKGVQSINLYGCKQITDEGLKHLHGIQSINLSWCAKVTDHGLLHLRGVRVITLYRCERITKQGLEVLKSAVPAVSIDSDIIS